MIPVRGYDGHGVAVLGLGRSGLAAARALRAGGAEVVCWDDGAAARGGGGGRGFAVEDLAKGRGWDGVVALIVSPGIPHLYPAPHRAIEEAYARGVAVDNDIGLFFRSFATEDWEEMDDPPRVICVTGSNGKSTTTALIAPLPGGRGQAGADGGQYRAWASWTWSRGMTARWWCWSFQLLPDGPGPGAGAGCGGVFEPFPRSPGPARRASAVISRPRRGSSPPGGRSGRWWASIRRRAAIWPTGCGRRRRTAIR